MTDQNFAEVLFVFVFLNHQFYTSEIGMFEAHAYFHFCELLYLDSDMVDQICALVKVVFTVFLSACNSLTV